MNPNEFTRRYMCRPIHGNGKSTLSMWKTMGEINCAMQIEAMLNRPNRNNRVWPEGAWGTYERNDGWKDFECSVRGLVEEGVSCKDVVFDFLHDFSSCQEVVAPDVEDLL